MAASMVLHRLCAKSVLQSQVLRAGVLYTQTCDASKMSGGSYKYKKRTSRPKHRGLKVQDGHFVHKGQVLVRQLGLRYYPGENVDVGSDLTLKAMVDGKVIISCEQLNPLPDSPLYEKVQDGLVIHKKFLNIYPAPLHGKFRMIDLV